MDAAYNENGSQMMLKSIQMKSGTPPNPRPRSMSPAIFRNEIDDLKSQAVENQTSINKRGCVLSFQFAKNC